jgi:hypothetical protein
MSEYLSKEEIKQWRSSLEKITLEEYAARLGKKIAEEKPTNDLADIVLHGQPVVSYNESWSQPKTERITTIAQRAFDREQEIAPSPFSISKLKLSINDFGENKTEAKKAPKQAPKKQLANTPAKAKTEKPIKEKKETVKAPKTPKAIKAVAEVVSAKPTGDEVRDEVRVVFKKTLTDREQKVFDYFNANQDKIVYAKDLAALLELPRDYVYKYINATTEVAFSFKHVT